MLHRKENVLPWTDNLPKLKSIRHGVSRQIEYRNSASNGIWYIVPTPTGSREPTEVRQHVVAFGQ